jgi:hypothetical protein
LLSDTEPDLLNDAIDYSFLLRSCPLTKRFGEELVAQVIRLLQGAEWKEAYRPLRRTSAWGTSSARTSLPPAAARLSKTFRS